MRRVVVLVALAAAAFVVTLLVEPNLVVGLRSPRALAWVAAGGLVCAVVGLGAARLGAKPVVALVLAAIPAVVATGLVVVKPIVNPRELTEALPTVVGPTSVPLLTSASAPPTNAASARPIRSASATPAPPAATGPTRVATGRLTALAGHSASGHVSTYRLADGSHIIRFESVSIGGTPDPEVYLLNGRDRSGKRGGLHLGELKAEKGSFNYVLPARFVGTDFTVLVWCERFAVNIAHSTQA